MWNMALSHYMDLNRAELLNRKSLRPFPSTPVILLQYLCDFITRTFVKY